MNSTIRATLEAIRYLFKSLDDNYWIRDEGMVPYKTALVSLQSMIEHPDELPTTIVQSVVADSKLDDLQVKVDGLGMNVTQRMAQLEAAVIDLSTKIAPAAPAAPAA